MMIISDPFQNVPKFDPNDVTDFKDWWSQEFLPVVKQLCLSEKETVQRLRSCLNKTACKAYDTMIRQTGDKHVKPLLKLMQSKFQCVEKASMSLLYSRKQRRGESVLDYAVTLEELYDKVNPDCEPKKRERVLAEVFRKGLPYGLLRTANISYPYPRRLNELLKRVRHYEREWLRTAAEREERNRNDHGTVRAVHTTDKPGDSKGSWAHSSSTYRERQTGTSTYADAVKRYRNSERQGICFRCNKPGHYANECDTNLRRESVTQRRQYNGDGYRVPTNCSKCGQFGHNVSGCPHNPTSRYSSVAGANLTNTVNSGPSAPRMASNLNTDAPSFVAGSSASARLVKVQMLNHVGIESSTSYKAPSISLQVQVNGIMVAGLIDMGAAVSLVSDDLYNYLGCPQLVTANANVQAKMVDETVIRLRKLTELDIDFGGYVAHKQKFFVVPAVHCPGILLGMNVVRYAQIRPVADRFEPERDRVYVGPKGIRATLSFSEVDGTGIPLIARIAVASTTEIPAGSVASVPVKVSGDLPGETGLVSFNESLEHQRLNGCECLVSLEDKSLTVPVFNSTDRAIRLRGESHIGEGMPVEVEDSIGKEMRSEVPGLEEDGPKLHTGVSEPITSSNLSSQMTWDETDLDEAEKSSVVQLLQKYIHTISTGDADLGRFPFFEHRIETEGPPVKLRNRPVAVNYKAEVKKIIEQNLEMGVKTPSFSPWSAPIVVALKKNGKVRLCVDYRKLNDATKKDVYAIPRIAEILDTLQGAQYLVSLDLASGYYQIPLAPEHREKTAFSTEFGHYEYNVLPFGLCNPPGTFQRIMVQVLKGLPGVVVYIDDIIISGTECEQTLSRLEGVFERLSAACMKINFKKCAFFPRELEFLGHIVSRAGIKPSPEKARVIREYPVPETCKHVRSFYGLCSFYRYFVHRFAEIAGPLQKLLRKGARFQWSQSCQEAFSALQHALCCVPILQLPNPDKPFILYTDASNFCLGAILGQVSDVGQEYVVAYASRQMSDAERKYAITEKEGLAVVFASTKFRRYLLGRKFTLVTDHSALKALRDKKDLSGRLERWALVLSQFDFEVVYKPGPLHKNADALSRLEHLGPAEVVPTIHPRLVTHSSTQTEDPDVNIFRVEVVSESIGLLKVDGEVVDNHSISAEQRNDATTRGFIEFLENGRVPTGIDEETFRRDVRELRLIDGLLKIRPIDSQAARVILPTRFQTPFLQEAHDNPWSGHFGFGKTVKRLKRSVYWNGMDCDVKRHVENCELCALSKSYGAHLKAKLKPLGVPREPFEFVGADLLSLPETHEGEKYVLAFICHLTKYLVTYTLKQADSKSIAWLFAMDFCPKFGVPKTLLTDQGSNLTSDLMTEVIEFLGVEHLSSVPYHHQTNGLVERCFRTLRQGLRVFCGTNQTGWSSYIGPLTFAYNTSDQESIRMTPYFAVFGREARTELQKALEPQLTLQEVEDQLLEAESIESEEYALRVGDRFKEIWEVARKNSHAAKEKMENDSLKSANVKEADFHVGDLVIVTAFSASTGHSSKMLRHRGPAVVRRIKFPNLEIRIREGTVVVDRIVHVNQVRRYKGKLTDPDLGEYACAECGLYDRAGQGRKRTSWVQCDQCEKWYHQQCVMIASNIDITKSQWLCWRCKV